MKSDSDVRTNINASAANLSNGNNSVTTNGSAQNNQTNHNASQRKSAIHDLTQVLIEDCQKLMLECHKSASKYHNNLLAFSNGNLNDTLNKEELKCLRTQNYKYIKSSLEKLIPQIDQVNFNDNDLYFWIQQIIAYLEYLKFEFVRHFYILKSFAMQNDHIASQIVIRTDEERYNDIAPSMDLNKKIELFEIQTDINEIEQVIHKLSQKYFIFVPDIDDLKTWSKKNVGNYSKMGSYSLLSKFKFICCFCSPKYI